MSTGLSILDSLLLDIPFTRLSKVHVLQAFSISNVNTVAGTIHGDLGRVMLTLEPDSETFSFTASCADISALLSCRFIKIPLRPAGTEKWTEEKLQALVTRDSIVGVSYPKTVEQFEKEGEPCKLISHRLSCTE